MVKYIQKLKPIRWKVFQCLLIEGENVGDDALRNAETFVINKEKFKYFIKRHSCIKEMVPEDNDTMRVKFWFYDLLNYL